MLNRATRRVLGLAELEGRVQKRASGSPGAGEHAFDLIEEAEHRRLHRSLRLAAVRPHAAQ
jgi:hypothetical protein